MSLTSNLFLDRKENTLKRIYKFDPWFWTPNLAHQLMNDCRPDPFFSPIICLLWQLPLVLSINK
jgi:hypothetical protein